MILNNYKEMWPNWILCLIVALTFQTCNSKENQMDAIIADYYQTYNQRQDFEKFLSFYGEKIVLEDIINGDKIIGKTALRDFFDWDNAEFKSLDSNTLIITNTITDGNTSVVKGYFTKFKWGQAEFEAMHFTTILTFNTANKIVKQVDWINYPSTLINYNQRKNSNEWIK